MSDTDRLQHRLDLLLEFGGLALKETRLAVLLELLAAEVEKVLNCEHCTVYILDRRSRKLWTRAARGCCGNCADRAAAVAAGAADSGETVSFFTGAGGEDPELCGVKTMLTMPLKDVSGNTMGVFQAVNKLSGSFDAEDEAALRLMGSIAASAIGNAQLYENLFKTQLEAINRLAVTAEYREQKGSSAHLRHVSEYAALIASGMGLRPQEVENIRYASMLHDIGKVAIPDSILLKPGKLSEAEFSEMKKHAAYGAEILRNAESPLLRIACEIAGFHHEKFDGSGYPSGVSGENIPLYARIMAVADVFDALCEKRIYKKAWTPEAARQHILSESGRAFDPAVVAGFEKVFPKMAETAMSD